MRIVVGAALLLATAAAFAQRVPAGLPGLGGIGGHHDRREARAAEEEQDATQAAAAVTDSAKRDGDEKLTCEQLQTEMSTIQSDPAMQAFLSSQGAAAGEQLAGITQAQQMMEQMQANRPSIVGSMAKGMAQGLNPFGQIGAKRRAAKQQAEVEAQVAEIQKAMPTGMQNGDVPGGLGANTPMMMRAGRVLELAQQKKCDFMSNTQPQPPESAQPQK